MKYIWEADDIDCGRVVINNNDTEHWLIGYRAEEHSGERFCLISLCDGMIQRAFTREGLAAFLNEGGKRPVFPRAKQIDELIR